MSVTSPRAARLLCREACFDRSIAAANAPLDERTAFAGRSIAARPLRAEQPHLGWQHPVQLQLEHVNSNPPKKSIHLSKASSPPCWAWLACLAWSLFSAPCSRARRVMFRCRSSTIICWRSLTPSWTSCSGSASSGPFSSTSCCWVCNEISIKVRESAKISMAWATGFTRQGPLVQGP